MPGPKNLVCGENERGHVDHIEQDTWFCGVSRFVVVRGALPLAWVCLLVVLSSRSGCCVLLYLDLTWARMGRRTSETTSLSPIWPKTGRRILRADPKQVGDSPSPTCLRRLMRSLLVPRLGTRDHTERRHGRKVAMVPQMSRSATTRSNKKNRARHKHRGNAESLVGRVALHRPLE